jgi:hypothetical protein
MSSIRFVMPTKVQVSMKTKIDFGIKRILLILDVTQVEKFVTAVIMNIPENKENGMTYCFLILLVSVNSYMTLRKKKRKIKHNKIQKNYIISKI